MIIYINGDLFDSPAQVLVNTVNTVGVMGKGIAREFKRQYPKMFIKYQQYCKSGQLTVGKLWIYKTEEKWILNFPTKTTWREPSRLEYIEAGLKTFVREYVRQGITSVAFPTLGCGNGELEWETQVKPLMESYLSQLPMDVFIYLYKE
jgi:O-acetyl-ADP-ribose deacetylase (regulator of RNase III)